MSGLRDQFKNLAATRARVAMEGGTAEAAPIAAAGPSPDDGWTRDYARKRDLLAIDKIIPDAGQPRKTIDPGELAVLAANVQANGILEPVLVEWLPDRGLWQLVYGERRLAAAKAAGETTIPAARTAGSLSRLQRLRQQRAENALRVDLDPIEEAALHRELMIAGEWNQTQLCTHESLDATAVSRSLKLLDLDLPVQGYVSARLIVPRAALELAGLPAEGQREIAERIIAEALTIAQTADAVAAWRARQRPAQPAAPAPKRLVTRERLPREVIRIESGRVIVEANGDVLANLRRAIDAYVRQRTTPEEGTQAA